MFSFIKQMLINLPGVITNRKLIVFLADDYGTIRISSKDALDRLERMYPAVTDNRFNKFDGIASSADLAHLFEVLYSVKDKAGHPAVFTPVTIAANPDFDAIRKANLSQYYYEPYYETLSKLPEGNQIKNMWKEGMKNGIFIPEYHGREHLNVRFWMKLLQSGDKHVREAFNLNSIGIDPATSGKKYMAAFDVENIQHQYELKDIAIQGLDLFEKQFGFRAQLFTPSALIHHDSLHENLKKGGITLIDMARLRYEPTLNGAKKRRYHYMGQNGKFGQRYLTRNVMFEPNEGNKDWVDSGLKDIETAFKYKKPAVISTHRVNFVSSKCEANRDKGLKSLKQLLDGIVKRWPEIEFVQAREVFNKA